MSKILKSIVGLAIITSSIGLTATPAKAESKPAQCKRFKQSIAAFNRQIHNAVAHNTKDPIDNINRRLSVNESGLRQLQAKQFSDPKIRSFQQSALNIHVRFHNDLASLGDAIENGDRAAARSIYKEMMTTAIGSSDAVDRQIVSYCGRSK
jgi:hypothetical protein